MKRTHSGFSSLPRAVIETVIKSLRLQHMRLEKQKTRTNICICETRALDLLRFNLNAI